MSVLFLPVCTWTAFWKQLVDLLWIYWESPLTSYKLEKNLQQNYAHPSA